MNRQNRFLMLWAVAVLAVATALIAHLALRYETIRLGYEVGAARREQRKLLDDKRILSVENATLRESHRVEAVARGTLKMQVPRADQIVTVERRSGRPAGRMQ